MTPAEIAVVAIQLMVEIEKLIPAAMQNPEDRDNSQGNVTLMIIAEDGRIFGHMFGTDNRVRRGTSRSAWQKATQVWMTAQATGQFEKQVYGSAQVDPGHFGLQHPDLIGWDGGLPVVAADGTKLAVAMSGFSGQTDCTIIRNAVARVPGLSMP